MKVIGGLVPAGSYQGEIVFEGALLAARSTETRSGGGLGWCRGR